MTATTPPTRPSDALRDVTITTDYTELPLSSVLIACGKTRVLCTASLEERVPPFRADKGGWLTAEYAMLPGSTPSRVVRASTKGRPDGRATEIQRLVGRSLRAGFDLDRLGVNTLWIDCDVLQADGGTRTAAITGGWVAARIAAERLVNDGKADPACLLAPVTAVSVGVVDGRAWLDLDYRLDSRADVDLNVVMTGAGDLVEVQGTGERGVFSRAQLDELLDLAEAGCDRLRVLQLSAVRDALFRQPGVRRR